MDRIRYDARRGASRKHRALAVAAIALLPWWPGGERGFEGMTYGPRIPVVNTIGYLPHLQQALNDWNACGSVYLYRAPDVPPKAPGTITIVNEVWVGTPPPWGSWVQEIGAGVVSLGPGWTRSKHVIEHELGHALGFAHTQRRSVMSDTPTVTPLDCQGLLAYYGG